MWVMTATATAEYTAFERPAVGVSRYDVTMTRHFLAQAVTKGFTPAQIVEAIEDPYKVTVVTAHEGQIRYCGGGIAVVIDETTMTAITCYLDGVITERREDQTDAAAMNSRRLASVR